MYKDKENAQMKREELNEEQTSMSRKLIVMSEYQNNKIKQKHYDLKLSKRFR